MSAVILQETLPFDFEADAQSYAEEDRKADLELCRAYFFRWAGAFGHLPNHSPSGGGSEREAAQPITFEEFQAAAERLAR